MLPSFFRLAIAYHTYVWYSAVMKNSLTTHLAEDAAVSAAESAVTAYLLSPGLISHVILTSLKRAASDARGLAFDARYADQSPKENS